MAITTDIEMHKFQEFRNSSNLDIQLESPQFGRMVGSVEVKHCSTMEEIVEVLSQRREVQWIERSYPVETSNDYVRGICETGNFSYTPFETLGLNGQDQIVGIVDSGVDMQSCFFRDEIRAVHYVSFAEASTSAADLNHRKVVQYITFADDGEDDSGHGTHVSGSLVGKSINESSETVKANGAAFEAKLSFFDIGFPDGGLTVPADLNENVFSLLYRSGARIMSNSWNTASNNYDFFCLTADEFMWENPDALVLFSSGNGGRQGLNSANSPSTFKNGVSVGASLNAYESFLEVDPQEYNSLYDIDSVGRFSGRGPTADGRLKPDVLAPGLFVRSALGTGDSTEPVCATARFVGTSMSCPAAAAMATITRQYFLKGYYPSGVENPTDGFIPSGALLKAILIHSGQPMTRLMENPIVNLTEYPSNIQGYGRVQLNSVLKIGSESNSTLFLIGAVDDEELYAELVDQEEQHEYVFRVGADGPFRVSFCYTDYPASTAAVPMVNVLSVNVTDLGSGDVISPYEHGGSNAMVIDLPDATTGLVLKVTVFATRLSVTQSYSLVVTGGLLEPLTAPSPSPSFSPTAAPTMAERYMYHIAGTGDKGFSGDGVNGKLADLDTVYDVWSSENEVLYIADSHNHRIRVIDDFGIISTFAGCNSTAGFSGDGGMATSAELSFPRALTGDSDFLYISDSFNHRVRRVFFSLRTIETIAGGGSDETSVELQATDASLNVPVGSFLETSMNILYFCDMRREVLRSLTVSTGVLKVVAGALNSRGSSGDGGPATSATLYFPFGVWMDSSGSLFVSERENFSVRKIFPDGIISLYAGTPTSSGYVGDGGRATDALLSTKVRGLSGDSNGVLYIADTDNHRVRFVDPTGIIGTLIGTGTTAFNGNGLLATSTNIRGPMNMHLTSRNGICVAEGSGNRLRCSYTDAPSATPTAAPSSPTVSPTLAPSSTPSLIPPQYIYAVAGTGEAGGSGDGGRAQFATLAHPYDVWVAADETIYIADGRNHRIRTVDPETAFITTLAGTGTKGFRGEGAAATIAQLRYPRAVAGDNVNSMFISDSFNNRVRHVALDTTVINTVAGGGADFVGSGIPGTSAHVNSPADIEVDVLNNVLFFCEMKGNLVRKLDLTSGILLIIAGTVGVAGYSGDGGLATEATLSHPFGIWMDSAGAVYFTERENGVIRKISSDGIVSLFAGVPGTTGFFGENTPATDAVFSAKLRGLSGDAMGNLFISDTNNNRVRMIDFSGIITTAVGTGLTEFNGNGLPALESNIKTPMGLFATNDSQIYFAEGSGQRVRATLYSSPTFTPSVAPTIEGFVAPSRAPTDTPTAAPTQRAKYVYALVGDGMGGINSGSFSGDLGDALAAEVNTPYGIIVRANSDILLVDNRNHRIRVVERSTNIITTVVGSGTKGFSGDGGPATSARLNHPRHVLELSGSEVLVSDGFNHRIRKVDEGSGIVETLVGGGTDPISSSASLVELQLPLAMFLSGSELYWCEAYANVVRRLDLVSLVVEIVVGQIGLPGSTDGPATSATLNFPWGVYIDSVGVMFISDRDNFDIRKVDNGVVSTFAGTTGVYGFAGDGGPATEAKFSFRLRQVWGDSEGNIYVSDTNNHRIRKIKPNGIILTEVGTGRKDFSGNGQLASETNIRTPTGLFVTHAGEVYFAEGHGQRVRAALYSNPQSLQ